MYRSSIFALTVATLFHASCARDAAPRAPGDPAATSAAAAEPPARAADVPQPQVALGTCRVLGADRAVLLSAFGAGDGKSVYGGLLGDEIGEAHGLGGLGLKGQGPGGGGTAWGTLGSGTSVARKQPPKVVPGKVVPTGNLDKNIIRRIIRSNLRKIKYCYEKQLLVNPNLAGTVKVDFVIDAKGNVASAQATGLHNAVASCVAGVVRGMRFPAPAGGGIVKVSYPFKFQTSSGGASSASQPSVPFGEPSSSKEEAMRKAREAGIAGAVGPREAYGRGCLDVAPGESLLAGLPAVEACYRAELDTDVTLGGRLFLSLTSDESGKLTERKATGVGSDRFRKCVADAFAAAELPGWGPKDETASTAVCSIGLHNPKQALVDEETDMVTVQATKLLLGDAVLGNQIEWSTDPEGNAWRALNLLLQALPKDSKDRTMFLAAQPDVDAAAYITNVSFVAHEAERHHFLYARADAAAGRVILNPLGSPAWSRYCGDVASREPLVALLAPDDISIGTVEGRVHVPPVDGKPHFIGFARALRKLKRKNYRHRSDLEIAALPGVPYRVLAEVIEIAADTGFFDVTLVDLEQADVDPRRLAPATAP